MSKKILFALTGSIACYKACQSISTLSKEGFKIQTVVSNSALNFIGKATLEGLTGLPVLTSSYQDGHMMSHINEVRNSDVFVIAPASAKTINGLASGALDGIIGDLFLANNFLKPTLLFPAMNSQMLLHPATQDSLLKLQKWGAHVFLGEDGDLACGEYGNGRLLEADKIVATIKSFFISSEKEKEMQI